MIVDSLDEAVAIANRYAPEHLQVAVADGDVDHVVDGVAECRRDPDRSAHPVQRRQLRDRLPGVAADERVRARVVRASRPTRS